jgi:hypothetical protein
MRTKAEERLGQIENELTPKQKFFAWHDKELYEPSIRSPEDYRRWAIDNWTVPSENEKMGFIDFFAGIAASIKEQSRAEGQLIVEKNLRLAYRDLLFLYTLGKSVRMHFMSQLALMEYLAQRLTISARILKEHLQRGKPSYDESWIAPLSDILVTLAELTAIVLDQKSTVDYLQRQYFEGHSILNSNHAKSLLQFYEIVRTSEELLSLCNTACLKQSQKKTDHGSRADTPSEHNSLWNLLNSEVDPVKHTQYLVDLARAKTLKCIGEHQASYDFRKTGIEGLLKHMFPQKEMADER